MSQINQVMITAKALMLAGKTPTLALIKNKLEAQIPMPVIIKGLQRFKALSPQEQLNLTANFTTASTPITSTKSPLEKQVEQLEMQVKQLMLAQQALLARIEVLEQQGS
ncbi:hypothetical protein [Shewanella marina]|uniref:hypothetical protein n=1 Tax=Shewanella marina TaxID=487319 RepID=UPI00046F4D74|nr:hypothetical protein [Shewanella marina]